MRHKRRTFWRNWRLFSRTTFIARSHFANIENKKVIAENQCEKHENQGLTVTEILPLGHSLIRKMRKHTGASKVQNNGF